MIYLPDRLLVELDIADDLKIQQINIEQLPKNWNALSSHKCPPE
jgi:hypothetical protein